MDLAAANLVRTRISRPVVSPDSDPEFAELFRLDDEESGELLLVRHAQPCADSAERLDHAVEAPLSPDGTQATQRLAERLSSLWVDAVYTAPERRAAQTASILAASLGRPLLHVPALAELEFEGEQCSPGRLAERFIISPRWDALPGFEPTRRFRSRAIQAIEKIIAGHPSRRVVVVTHASVINAYLSMLLDIPRDYFFQPDHTSVSTIRWRRDLYAVRAINDAAHLRGSSYSATPAI